MAEASNRESIDDRVFQHLVQLAALELRADEAEYLRRELNAQLAAIRNLEAIQIAADLPITSHGVPYSPAIRPAPRPDQIQPSELADAILGQAPEVLDRYIVVPDLSRTDLE